MPHRVDTVEPYTVGIQTQKCEPVTVSVTTSIEH